MLVEANDPAVVNILGLLQHLSTQELKDMLNDDDKLNFIIRDSSKVKSVEAEKELIMARNKSLAEFNLSWEPKISEGRQRLIELYEKAATLKQGVEEKESAGKGETVSIETALVMLQTAATKIEEESELIAEKLRDGDYDIDTFIEEFMAKRKLAHLRRVRADKMQELVTKQKQLRPAPPPPTYINQPNSSVPPYPLQTSPGGLPYPIGPSATPTGLPYPMYPGGSMYPRF